MSASKLLIDESSINLSDEKKSEDEEQTNRITFRNLRKQIEGERKSVASTIKFLND